MIGQRLLQLGAVGVVSHFFAFEYLHSAQASSRFRLGAISGGCTTASKRELLESPSLIRDKCIIVPVHKWVYLWGDSPVFQSLLSGTICVELIASTGQTLKELGFATTGIARCAFAEHPCAKSGTLILVMIHFCYDSNTWLLTVRVF